jgi:hypothetical protein
MSSQEHLTVQDTENPRVIQQRMMNRQVLQVATFLVEPH